MLKGLKVICDFKDGPNSFGNNTNWNKINIVSYWVYVCHLTRAQIVIKYVEFSSHINSVVGKYYTGKVPFVLFLIVLKIYDIS